MRRIHSIELHEQPWFPKPWRDHITGFLSKMTETVGAYGAIIPIFAEHLRQAKQTQLVDLCSGAGGPARWVQAQLREREGLACSLIVTDLYPNREAWRAAALEGSPEPVNALDVPSTLRGVRLMFSGFHHFQPEQARGILQDAVDKGEPFGIFELTPRTVPAILVTLFSFLTFMLFTPTISPRRLSVFIFTYLVPILPLVVVWDGVISCLRTYAPEELLAMCAQLKGAQGWRFEAQMTTERGPVIYLIGRPPEALSVPSS